MEFFRVPMEIPFYSQRVDFDDVTLQGFKSIEDAKYWQERGCGIASVKMIIDGFQRYRGLSPSEPYGKLVYRGLEMGAHCERGWIHKGLVELAKQYNLSGQTFRLSNVCDIQIEIEKNRPCIASVSACFRGGKMNSRGEIIQKGGHLVVVTGVVRKKGEMQGFIVNHPSSYLDFNWENHFVRVEDFEKSFSGAFMSFWEGEETLCAESQGVLLSGKI